MCADQNQKMQDLEAFLRNEKQTNMTNGSWSKLSRSLKIKKVTEYALAYKAEHGLTDEEGDKLRIFLKECINKNKIQKVKDISYDKTTGHVKKINILAYNGQTGRFTLKNSDVIKKTGTLKRAASVATATPISVVTDTDT